MQGYYRFPTIWKNKVVFVCEDDLWSVSLDQSVAHRLTSNLGETSHPFFSPDGRYIAFVGRDEGHPEIYCMPSQGGVAKRLTYLGAVSSVVGWSKDGRRILFASNADQWYLRMFYIYSVDREKDIPEQIAVGPANHISLGPGKTVVIGRNTADPARWKRYRGGTVGEVWIDPIGHGDFRKLISVKGNITSPMWVGERIYFISDHEGIGNIYSCMPSGKDLQRHTYQTDYYVRNAKTDGKNIVYHAGGNIFIHYPKPGITKKIDIQYHSPRSQTNRKFVEAAKYLEDYAIHPKGEIVSVTCRGKVFSMPNWEGSVTQIGQKSGARYRLGRWLYDKKRMVSVTDESGEDSLQVQYPDQEPKILPALNIGRPIELEPSPKKPLVCLTNHRFELILVNINTKKSRVLDKSKYDRIANIAWSPDGIWIAYSFMNSEKTSCIKLCNALTRKSFFVTQPVMQDFSPSFDPDGKYLYFLSNRDFDPVYDTLQFELSFPANIKPYLITLRKELPTPFQYREIAPTLEKSEVEEDKEKVKEQVRRLKIDLTGIEDRIIGFPLPPAKYVQICANEDKVLFLVLPIEGGAKYWLDEMPASGTLESYFFKEQKVKTIAHSVTSFKVAQESDVIIYRSKDRLRVVKPIERIEEKIPNEPVGYKSGWLDLTRIKVSVEPKTEWRQMYDDAWRLQRDHFWTKDMSGVDWHKVYKRYLPLLERVGTRSEFSDLIWEMQGELGTSHAYEWGGDYRQEPQYKQGFLGADLEYDKKHDAYRIRKIIKGDPWHRESTSPLLAPGINAREGELILAVDGKKVSSLVFPQELLVNRANADVSITISDSKGRNKRTVSIKALSDESALRYRNWVEQNRQKVHSLSKNKIGYVHVPDMGPMGFGEFHRYFLVEIQYPGMVVDVRFNRGGHVSQLLIEKLARKRIGYDKSRWRQPAPYPYESVLGPIVCLTNENAGSDGDIFSHAFKLYKIGPLIGKRTWGGVIGIGPYFHLSDGGLTTQPEYSFWFTDVGWGVENYGTDPDIYVENRPQDYVQGKDPQLARAVKECLRMLDKQRPKMPDFKKRPSLKLPGRKIK